MIKFVQHGKFDKTVKFLGFLYRREFLQGLDKYGEEGVAALKSATPVDTGKTAASWFYEIETTPNRITISWCNDNMNEGIPIVILIQYGHARQNGYYLRGRDFINPAIRPIFDNIAEEIWKEVVKA